LEGEESCSDPSVLKQVKEEKRKWKRQNCTVLSHMNFNNITIPKFM
jgi:hypothetical protein